MSRIVCCHLQPLPCAGPKRRAAHIGSARGARVVQRESMPTTLISQFIAPKCEAVLQGQSVSELDDRGTGADHGHPKREIRTVVVDDSPAVLHAMCSVVERQPNLRFVGAASNGREALILARDLRPDLILLDVQMPVMSGMDATSCLGRDCPTTCVVIVTAHDSPELRRQCYKRGARGFILKEALNEQLPVVVRDLFGHSRE
jgi:CheY-like chemotaxis protein